MPISCAKIVTLVAQEDKAAPDMKPRFTTDVLIIFCYVTVINIGFNLSKPVMDLS